MKWLQHRHTGTVAGCLFSMLLVLNAYAITEGWYR